MRLIRLDGIRGLAVLLVMGLHLLKFQTDTPLGFYLNVISQAGWTGVPLFFVLSGFLITGILVDTRTSENYWSSFYMRRSLRIFPLYFVFLAIYQIFVIQLQVVKFDPSRTAQAAQEIPWVWAYATNLLIAKKGAFITASLNHFWTLAIEEHFYLVWPAVIYFTNSEWLKRVCWLGIGIAISSRIYLLGTGDAGVVAASVLTPCRMDSLLVGGLFCLAYRDFSKTPGFKTASWIIFSLSAALLSAFVLKTGALNSGEPVMVAVGLSVVAAFFGSALVLVLLAGPRNLFTQVFESSSLRFFGKYSYALYVLHHPINIAMERIWPTARWAEASGSWLGATLVHSLLVGGISIGAAIMSWHFLEKRFLRLKDRFSVRNANANDQAAVEVVPSRA